MADDAASTGEVEELSHEELRAEYQELLEKIRGEVPHDCRPVDLHDRRDEVWKEMKSRTDAEPPECPDCDGKSWAQTMGGPKRCTGCDKVLHEGDMELIEAIDNYWETVLSGGSRGVEADA